MHDNLVQRSISNVTRHMKTNGMTDQYIFVHR